MNDILQAFSMVAIAEIGDKTQLLSIILAARYQRFWPIIAGIFVATLVNHAFVAWAGSALGGMIDHYWLNIGVGALFIGIGLWALIPDDAPEGDANPKYGAFVASTIAFFIAEMGDKTQLATLTLGASMDLFSVIIGTTVGMLAANIPAVLFGETIISKLPLRAIRIGTCVMFVGVGVYMLVNTLM